MAMAFAIGFDLTGQVVSFMVGVPTEMIDTGDALTTQADTQFGTELNGLVLFAPDDGSHMRLVDADDAIITAPGSAIKHLLLLEVKLADDPVLAKLFTGEWDFLAGQHIKHGFNMTQVTVEVAQLLADGLAVLFVAGSALLDQSQIILAGVAPVSARLLFHPR